MFLAVAALLLTIPSAAQSDPESDPKPVPLGDLARALRTQNAQIGEHTVIDNDNLSKVMDEVESRRLTNSSLVFSFDGTGKTFQVSSPDVTCSLSFNARATSLISDPYVSRDLPPSEIVKLDGPATLDGDNLQVAVFNGSDWRVDEITVGLTIVHRKAPTVAYYGAAKLVPASSQTTALSEKHSDSTTLYKMRAAAAPSATTVFKTGLNAPLGPDEEWHWAIVQAKGIPPRPAALAPDLH